MTETGDELRTLDGTTFLITQSAQATGGERIELELTLPPGAPSPPLHFHPKQTEEWHVLSGTISVHLDGHWRDLREGASVTMPPGQVHTLRNSSREIARVRDVHVPAGDFQEYVETLHRLSEAGKIKSLRRPSTLIYLAMVLREHRRLGGQVTASGAQRVAETVLASVGRLLRYQIG